MTHRLKLHQLDISGGTQPRESVDQALIKDYADAMKEGAAFPPVDAVYDGATYWLVDGFHRLAAAAMAGIEEVDARVTEGSHEDAVWESLAANATHGKRRTTADKQRAIMRVLLHEEWQKKSDREIARHLMVSHPTVSKHRGEMESTGKIYQSNERVGADGRTINTSNIGKQEQGEEEASTAQAPVPTPEAAPKVRPPVESVVPMRELYRVKLTRMPELPTRLEDAESWEWEELAQEYSRRLAQMETVMDGLNSRLRAVELTAHASAPAPGIWGLLGVTPGDDVAARRAIKKLQRATHPDHCGGDSTAFDVTQRLAAEVGI